MKVLRVLNELKPSGVEVNLRVSAAAWASRGFNLEILSTGAREGPYADALRAAGYTVRHIPLKPFPSFVSSYLGLLRSENYDLVHIHPERANFYTCTLARLATRRPVIRSIHNGFRFDGVLRLRRKLQRSWLRTIGVTHVSVSASVQGIEAEYFSNPTRLIYNSFDSDRYCLPSAGQHHQARAALGVADDEFVIATMGNCSPIKNHPALIEAVACLRNDVRLRLVHVGLEDPSQSERALCDRLGISPSVTFMGQVDDPLSVLHAADCFVMPSLYEGFSNAALEALGCGLPSVMANVQGLGDLAEFIPTIWWVEPHSASIRRALQAVKDMDPGSLEALRSQQASLTHEAFGLERAVSQYETLYCAKARPAVAAVHP